MVYTEEFGEIAARVRTGLGFVEGQEPELEGLVETHP
jgi:hypothetical protein